MRLKKVFVHFLTSDISNATTQQDEQQFDFFKDCMSIYAFISICKMSDLWMTQDAP